MQINPMYVNSLLDQLAKAMAGHEVQHVTMALVTYSYTCLTQLGKTDMEARVIIREMLDYAIDKSIDTRKLKDADKRILKT